MRKFIKDNSAFTLVELVVTIAVFSIFSVGILGILNASNRASINIMESMVYQQQAEGIVSDVRAQLSNVQDLSVWNVLNPVIPDPNIEKTDAEGNKYIDDYCYIVADDVDGGVIVNIYDPDTKTRSETKIGGPKRISGGRYTIDKVSFVKDGNSISITTKPYMRTVDSVGGVSETPIYNFELATNVAVDDECMALDELYTPIGDSAGRVIRFRRIITEEQSYQWKDVKNLPVDPETQTADISGVNYDTKIGSVAVVNTKDEYYRWSVSYDFDTTKIKKVTRIYDCDDMDAVITGNTHVTLTAKAPGVSRSNSLQTFSFKFDSEAADGVQSASISDNGYDSTTGAGTGVLTVTNTKDGAYSDSKTLTISGQTIESMTITTAPSVGTASVSGSTISFNIPKSNSPVSIPFSYKVKINTGSVNVKSISIDKNNKTGSITVENTKATEAEFTCDVDFGADKATDLSGSGLVVQSGLNTSKVTVESTAPANQTSTFNFTFVLVEADKPLTVSFTPGNSNYDYTFNGVTGKATDVYAIVKNSNNKTFTGTVTAPVSGMPSNAAIAKTDANVGSVSLSGTNATVTATLDANEETVANTSGKHIMFTYFVPNVAGATNVNVHFDSANTVNTATGWVNMTVGFAGGVVDVASNNKLSGYAYGNAPNRSDTSYSVQEGQKLEVCLAVNNNSTFGDYKSWTYNDLVNNNITDIWVYKTQILTTKPDGWGVASTTEEPQDAPADSLTGTGSLNGNGSKLKFSISNSANIALKNWTMVVVFDKAVTANGYGNFNCSSSGNTVTVTSGAGWNESIGANGNLSNEIGLSGAGSIQSITVTFS